MRRLAWLIPLFAVACGTPSRRDGGSSGDDPDLAIAPLGDLAAPPLPDWGAVDGAGCQAGQQGCYTVYAHGDKELYRLDLANRKLVEVGLFKAPKVPNMAGKLVEDVITDLAVAPDDKVYGVSNSHLYQVDPKDGHVTMLGSLKSCGQINVALSFDNDGNLFAGDYKGAFCRIDLKSKPPTVTALGQLGGGLALAGDIVVVGDGTMYGTANRIDDQATGKGTVLDNLLVKLDPKSGRATIIGATGYPRMFGVAFEQGKVFGFTHDGSGVVITIDPKTGKGTLYGTFTDPVTRMPIAFAGAAVNPKVAPPPIQ